jgi:transglutaminase-like putative cysteine protease
MRGPARLMLLSFLAGCLLHVDRAPAWCTATAGCGLLWYWLHLTGRLALPARWVRFALAAVLLAAVVLSFGTLNGISAGSALLITMGSAKLLETRTTRDAVVVTTVALILVLAAGLDRQNLLRLPLYAGTCWLALATIAALGSYRAAQSSILAFRRAGLAMALAIPFALLAFVLVPRLPGALWALPGGQQAQTGLGDEMSPGSISDLAISEAIAFRVRFDGTAPPPSQRYWRGPVLHDFDGNTWRNERGRSNAVRPPVEFLSGPVRYQVTIEPHSRNWLFTLDTAAEVQGRRHFRTFDGQFLAARPVTETQIYHGVSHLRWRNPGALSILGRRRDTQLPAGRNPRTMVLARTLRAEADTDAAYAERVMRYFAEGGFEYTLTPPQQIEDSVDDLLFNARLGFCGHFASAYVTLMRAAGVPARVVTGYLGGTWNGIGGYYLVRQSDAHAWAEVWLDGQGWTRFDPTAMVAPGRLERGLAELLPETRSAADAFVQQTGWLRGMRDAWDAAGSWWRERVVNFNSGTQYALLSRLGLEGIGVRGMATLLLGGAILWGLLLALFMRPRTPQARPDALGRIWRRYLAVLARRGLPVAAHDGPESIRRRAQRRWPAAADGIARLTRRYEMLRFGPASAGSNEGGLAELRRHVSDVSRAIRRQGRAASAHAHPRQQRPATHEQQQQGED